MRPPRLAPSARGVPGGQCPQPRRPQAVPMSVRQDRASLQRPLWVLGSSWPLPCGLDTLSGLSRGQSPPAEKPALLRVIGSLRCQEEPLGATRGQYPGPVLTPQKLPRPSQAQPGHQRFWQTRVTVVSAQPTQCRGCGNVSPNYFPKELDMYPGAQPSSVPWAPSA